MPVVVSRYLTLVQRQPTCPKLHVLPYIRPGKGVLVRRLHPNPTGLGYATSAKDPASRLWEIKSQHHKLTLISLIS